MLISVLIGIVAWVYVVIITKQDMLLFGVSNYLRTKLPAWLFKPVIGCEYCVAGQIALWYNILTLQFNIFYIIVSICVSIFTVCLINKLMYDNP